jgi:hypothetical protein
MKVRIDLQNGETLQDAEETLEKALKAKKECSEGERYADPVLNELHDSICDRHEELLTNLFQNIQSAIKEEVGTGLFYKSNLAKSVRIAGTGGMRPGHKYIKREWQGDHFVYWYKDENGNMVAGQNAPEGHPHHNPKAPPVAVSRIPHPHEDVANIRKEADKGMAIGQPADAQTVAEKQAWAKMKLDNSYEHVRLGPDTEASFKKNENTDIGKLANEIGYSISEAEKNPDQEIRAFKAIDITINGQSVLNINNITHTASKGQKIDLSKIKGMIAGVKDPTLGEIHQGAKDLNNFDHDVAFTKMYNQIGNIEIVKEGENLYIKGNPAAFFLAQKLGVGSITGDIFDVTGGITKIAKEGVAPKPQLPSEPKNAAEAQKQADDLDQQVQQAQALVEQLKKEKIDKQKKADELKAKEEHERKLAEELKRQEEERRKKEEKLRKEREAARKKAEQAKIKKQKEKSNFKTKFTASDIDTDLIHTDAQKALIEGVDIYSGKKSSGGWTAAWAVSNLTVNKNGDRILVKGILPDHMIGKEVEDGAGVDVDFKIYNSAQRETLYYNVAQVLDMGSYISTTSTIKGSVDSNTGKMGQYFSVMKLHDSSYSEYDFVRHQTAVKEIMNNLDKTGETHKLAIMNLIMGSSDRHKLNFMVSTTHKDLKLIDHGFTFDYYGRQSRLGQLDYVRDGSENLHKNAKEWLNNLNVSKIEKTLKDNNLPDQLHKVLIQSLTKAQELSKIEGMSLSRMKRELVGFQISLTKGGFKL